MRNEGWRPVIDSGSSRIFDCNSVTLKALADDPGAGAERLFFRHSRLNHVIIIKQSVLPTERRSHRDPPVATKLFFPFNEHDPAEGGATIFLHDKHLEAALNQKCGVDRLEDSDATNEDLRILHLLGRLPTLDPFLIRDVLQPEGFPINERYLEITDEQWSELQGIIQQRFAPIVKAALPDAAESRAAANRLTEKMWAAKDAEALAPIIRTFGLPEDGALEILYAWKVVTFYSYQFRRMRPSLLELASWLKENAANARQTSGPMRVQIDRHYQVVRHELRGLWSRIEAILADYEDGYDKMFIKKTDPGPFLKFLRNCGSIFWEIGDVIGKIDHSVYCWDQITSRYPRRHVHPAEALEGTFAAIGEILGARIDKAEAARG